jgi:hypothetical protein
VLVVRFQALPGRTCCHRVRVKGPEEMGLAEEDRDFGLRGVEGEVGRDVEGSVGNEGSELSFSNH